jgi:hypothetical protein
MSLWLSNLSITNLYCSIITTISIISRSKKYIQPLFVIYIYLTYVLPQLTIRFNVVFKFVLQLQTIVLKSVFVARGFSAYYASEYDLKQFCCCTTFLSSLSSFSFL